MNVGSYRGAAALAAYEQWQGITSQNIAAGSVPGFKKTEVSFSCADGGKSKANSANTSQEVRGEMPKLSSKISFGQGLINPTGNKLDVAIRGSGFFQVQGPGGKTAYTRDGEFQVNASGALTTKEGYPVMGESGPLALQGSGPVTINSKGVVQQGNKTIGKLGIYNSSDPKNIVKLGGGLFAQSNPAVPLNQITTSEVVSGALESSNVAPLSEMVNLIVVSRAYEANQKVITTDDEETDKAIQALGNS